jgi:hypothetical protein
MKGVNYQIKPKSRNLYYLCNCENSDNAALALNWSGVIKMVNNKEKSFI